MAAAVGERSDRVTREVLALAGLVLIVDGVFIGAYFALGLVGSATLVKLGFTALWTLATLLVVLRGLGRIRAIRADSTS